MKKVLKYMSKYNLSIELVVFLKVFGTLAELLIPIIMAHMIDNVAPEKDILKISLWAVAMLACAVVAWWGNVVANRISSKVARDTTERIRDDLFAKSLSLSSGQIDEVTMPSLVSRLSSDTYNVHNMIGMIQRLGIRVPIMLVGGIIMTFFVDPILALVLVAIIPFVLTIVIYVSSKGIVLYSSLQKAVDSMVRKVRDDYTGIRVIKALSKTSYESKTFEDINKDVVNKETKAGVIVSASNPILNMILNLGMTLVILVGAYRVNAGKSQAGEITAFMLYFTIILNAVIFVSRLFITLSKGSASANRIQQILEKEQDLLTLQGKVEKAENEWISFNDVTFSYKGAVALKDINFKLKKGETLGIIGATGSGKTTLISLLMRFYDVDKGSIKIDGIDIRYYPKEELRKKFGVVLQNDFLMAASVRENIDFERGLSDTQIKTASQYAMASGFIENLKDCYDTMLEARGANFSGGQKQRLLIARALASDCEILILDDSSSALDYKTDAELRKTLTEKYGDRTIIMIAQRISSVRFADKIIVLDRGEIVGIGTDEELMENCDEYKKIYESQVH